MTELKPCPFCGGIAYMTDRICIKCYYYVVCEKCQGKAGGYINKQDAVDNWNMRVGK